MIDHDQSFKTSSDVVVTELDGENESVLLHLGTKKYYTLNETGVRIWQLLGEGYKTTKSPKKYARNMKSHPHQLKRACQS
jgi:hypothetical protein